MSIEKFTAKTIGKVLVAKEVYSYRFKVLENKEFSFEPGQYILLDIGSGLKRHYSISSSPLINNYFELLVDLKPGGPGSIFIKNLSLGDDINFIGPVGKFILPDTTKPNIIFLATGTGLAPIKSMLDTLIINEDYKNKNIYLYYGTKLNDHVIFKDYFIDILNKQILKKYQICLSQEVVHDEYYLNGYVTLFLDKLEKDIILDSSIFVCGGGQIVKSIVEVLVNFGLLESNIYYERFS